MKPIEVDDRYEPLSQLLGCYLNQNMGDASYWQPGEKKTAQNAIAYAVRTSPLYEVDGWIASFLSFMRESYDENQLTYILTEHFDVGIDPPPGVSTRSWLSDLLDVAISERSVRSL